MFSAVIPTFNRACFVPLAVESVLRQSFTDFEIIVVDDGSVDETSQALQPYLGRIRLMRQENRGVSAARNAAIAAAWGRWIVFLDSDDEWLGGYLELLRDLILRHPQAVGVVLNSVAVGANGTETNAFEVRELSGVFAGAQERLVERPFGLVIRHHVTTLQPCALRRDALLKTRLFDESLTIAEDLDLIAQVALTGPFVICNQIGARIIRRHEALVNLSKQFVHSGIRTRLSWARVYERFLKVECLSRTETLTLRKTYASNLRALGNLYLRAGLAAEARGTYKAALQLDHSPASAARLLFSLLPLRLGRFLLHKEGEVEPGVQL